MKSIAFFIIISIQSIFLTKYLCPCSLPKPEFAKRFFEAMFLFSLVIFYRKISWRTKASCGPVDTTSRGEGPAIDRLAVGLSFL